MRKILKEYRFIIGLLFGMFFIRTFIVDWNYIPSESMEPNLYESDYVLVTKSFGPSVFWFNNKLWTSGIPERGDVITFVPPHADVIFIKRVLGVPGDEVTIHDGKIILNGEHLTQVLEENSEYAFNEETNSGVTYQTQITKKDPLQDYSKTFTVPEGKLFVLGDHRNHSGDSRVWGYVDNEKVLGKVTNLFFSVSSKRSFFESIHMKI